MLERIVGPVDRRSGKTLSITGEEVDWGASYLRCGYSGKARLAVPTYEGRGHRGEPGCPLAMLNPGQCTV